ncbi:creatininase family protein [Paenibacillus qinlingensis]|uniref:Creatinine amidohydrolase n=1 Tax=Paenibacillus qinlingensis TaxID=1837343 RepID=A0ABU1NTX8_9BACL|nr:creatininase family protein [Paenibacillus qinlingensis]MDR6550442.1 creatinine amidohydrolase [Paenibacillus qinlingensis]
MSQIVSWAELFPREFEEKLKACPVVYLPLGLCEPHGLISAFGLDTFKAEFICQETARRTGGIVAPTMPYHIHENGPSARWLEDQVGALNPRLTSVPSNVFFQLYIYLLRTFYNAGFRTAVVVSGHGGAHVADLEWISFQFEHLTGMQVMYTTDFALAGGKYPGDHAGKYEISTFLYLRPDLVDATRTVLDDGKRFALDPSSLEATTEYGEEILNACIASLAERVQLLAASRGAAEDSQFLSFQTTEQFWDQIVQSDHRFASLQPREGQLPVSRGYRYKNSEFIKLR